MTLRTYFVETWGCQMNVLDSQVLAGLLQARGLVETGRVEDADVTLLNTCAVREKAVQKVLSRLGELRAIREELGRPRIVGLCGCVAEQDGAHLLSSSRVLSFVLGPGKIAMLPAAVDSVLAGERVAVTGFGAARDVDTHLIARGDGARQYVTAIHGCSQHCTFCVVPYTRGHEASRPLADVVREVGELAAAGVREITLLGQTVNAYTCPDTGADFAAILDAVCAVEGPWRIQFLTSHPRFFTDSLIETMARLPRLGSYLHLPFQAGSDDVLRRMHRGHTRDEYRALVGRIRQALPDVTLSTDVIVGFPGESEADFRQTLDLAEELRFGQLYGFVFSARPRTPAARYGDRVPRGAAGERLNRLFSLQQGIQLELNTRLVGRTVEVLVDGPAKRGDGQWQGRGADNRVVNFPGWPGIKAGDLVETAVMGATAHSLLGERKHAGSGTVTGVLDRAGGMPEIDG